MRATFKKSLAGWILLATILFLATGLPLAQEGDLDVVDLPGKWWKQPRVIRGLDLTPTQVDKIEAVFLEHRKRLIDLKARMEKDVLDYKELLGQDNINREAVLQKLDQIAATRTRIVRSTVMMQLDIRELLTPDQRAKLKQFRERFRELLRRRLRNGGEGGHPPRREPPPPR